LAAAARTADAKQARRILAIAMALDGHSRRLAAQAGGMDRQTLRDWVIRYNADGLAGLADRPRPGRRPRLAEAQRREVAKWVEDGPDPKTDGVVRWRCADLRDRIAAKFDVRLHERSVGKLLKKLDFSSMSVRPMHPQTDLAAQEAFKKTSPSWRAPRSRRSLPGGLLKSGFRMNPPFAIPQRLALWNLWLIPPGLASTAR
jgi:transposase